MRAFFGEFSEFAWRSVEGMGVTVRTRSVVSAVDADGVTVEGDGTSQRVSAATVLWAAGNEASPAGLWLGAETDDAGRIIVEPDLSVPEHPNIFAIGDTVLVRDAEGQPLPGVAPIARQQGRYVARLITARLRGAAPPDSFRVVDTGLWVRIPTQSGQ